jgi:hypothetical protein
MEIVWKRVRAFLLAVLVFGGLVPGAEATPIVETPNWVSAARMNVARARHTATLLSDGRVLVTGGWDAGAFDSAELFDPATGAWTVTGTMKSPRFWHTATLLPDGRVLVVGGITRGGWFYEPYVLDEIYDPATGEWVAGGGPFHTNDEGYRYNHGATRLESGGVLITGGWSWNDDIHSMSLLYDPPVAPPQSIADSPARANHQATLLPDGRVLVTGGWYWYGSTNLVSAGAQAFDPVARTWSSAGVLAHARADHTATLLADGTVVVAGGGSADVELFDPASNGWRSGARLSADRSLHTASLLPSGRVLIAGGVREHDVLADAELYDATGGRWERAGNLNEARWGHTATVLRDGRVLVAGGIGAGGGALAGTEILAHRLATSALTVVEYVNTQDFPGSPGGHYFYTDDPAEQTFLDTGGAGRFVRSGRGFKSGGSKRVCRFFGSTTPGPNSHFYTISDAECDQLKALQVTPVPSDVQQWNYEGLRFAQEPPLIDDDFQLSCPAGTLPVYRIYNNGYSRDGLRNRDSSHRYSTDRADIRRMITWLGWRDEGIAFCSPQQTE